MFQTTEGTMDLDFENMELYKQSGDLLYPMVPMPMTDRVWSAISPDGSQYLVQQVVSLCNRRQCRYNIYRVKIVRTLDGLSPGFVISYESAFIGTSEEYDLDV